MAKTTNENLSDNSKQQNKSKSKSDNNDKLDEDLYEELHDNLEDILNNEFDNEFETEYKEIPLKIIEPEPTFKNSYTEKLNIASKKREEALKKGSNKYIKYSSIGMEMIGSVILGGFGGNWLDKKLALGFPLFTITLILLGLAATFTHLIMQLNADRKEEEEKAKNAKN
jgi:F0F1-type ATP synthase assembly protein I